MYKTTTEELPVTVDFSQDLADGETVASVVAVVVSPSGHLVLQDQVLNSPTLAFNVTAGQNNTSYHIQVVVLTSNNRPLIRDVNISVQNHAVHPQESPDSFRTIIEELQAGESSRAVAVFQLSDSPDLEGAVGSWEVLDADGIVYSSGAALQVTAQAVTNDGVRVEVTAVVTVPSTIPPSAPGTRYQLRWTLQTQDGNSRWQQFDSFIVRSPVQAPNLGSLNAVELNTGNAVLGITLPRLFDHVRFQLFYESGEALSEELATDSRQDLSSGHFYSRSVDISQVPASLEPYVCVWKYWLDAYPNQVFTDSGQLYIINPSIASAMSDLRAFCNKAVEEDFVTPWDLMSYLRTGADDFNGFSNLTNFTMTNAKGGIRSGWMLFSQLRLLRARYLEEGSKAFTFSGQAVSLEQDRTQYLESVASTLEGQKPGIEQLKYQLSMRGNTGGDGSSSGYATGSAAKVGIGLHPLSRYSWRSFRRVLVLGR